MSDKQYPPLTSYIPSVMMFGIGAAFHAMLIYKKPATFIHPFGIGWGTFGALILAPHNSQRILSVSKVTEDVEK